MSKFCGSLPVTFLWFSTISEQVIPLFHASDLKLGIMTKIRGLIFWSTGLHFQLPRHRFAYFVTCSKIVQKFPSERILVEKIDSKLIRKFMWIFDRGVDYFLIFRKTNKIKIFHILLLLKEKGAFFLFLFLLIWKDIPFRYFFCCAEETHYKAWKQHEEIHCGWKATFT